ncbi:MAG: hypothetical protein GY862_28905 [Gammaproteobacteria bacterium]|nr:hypothetical protein [Gammaproteobacteria bacterium]
MNHAPYPGLRPFRREETDIFFGREEHADRLLEHLSDNRFLAVLGPSGCGKSSLVKTGLLAGIAAGFLKDDQWRIAELRPGHKPFARLAESLLLEEVLGAEYPGDLQIDAVTAREPLTRRLRLNSYSLHEVLRDLKTSSPFKLLILVDQFEEIFRYHASASSAQGRHESADEAAAFIALLLAAAEHPAVYVVLTMRSDFIGDCALFHGLPEAVNKGLYLTPRLTRDQLQEAIVEPARVFDGDLEPALVSRLLNDAGNDPDQLPLLQHALMRMWDLAGDDHRLTLEHYRQAGGLKNALSNHADSVFDALDEKQRRAAEILFRALTELGPDNRAVRRPAPLAEVAGLAEIDPQTIAALVEAFRAPGRSFLTPSPGTPLSPETILDISHESLIRQWRRLQDWVKDEAAAAALYRRLLEASQRRDEGQGELWRGLDLENAQVWWERFLPTALWAARYSYNETTTNK